MNYDYDIFEEENVFEDILCNDDPSNVINGSTLRHYVNVWGITKKLCNRLQCNKGDIKVLYEACRGYVDITSYIGKIDELVDICVKEEMAKEDAIQKNNQLISILKDKRNTLCGVGTRKVKCFLNKKIKQGDKLALVYRKALECEDVNITAKDTNYYYRDKVYFKKTQLILELIEIAKTYNYTYGYQTSDIRNVDHVIFFELPNMEQISWHNNLDDIKDIPQYNKPWDEKVNSTLYKIEDAINHTYGDEIRWKYNVN